MIILMRKIMMKVMIMRIIDNDKGHDKDKDNVNDIDKVI